MPMIFKNNKDLTNILFLGLIFLLPLFFFKLSFGSFDGISKSYLLWILAPWLLFSMVYRKLKEPEASFKMSALDFPFLIFGVGLALSAVFGFGFNLSFWGNPQVMILPLFSFLCLLFFYYFAINYLNDESKVKAVYRVLLLGFSVVIAFSLMAVILKWLSLFTATASFISVIYPAFGSFEDIAMYLVPLTLLSFLAAYDDRIRILPKTFLKVCFILGVLLLVAFNYIPAWWAILLGMSLVYVKGRKERFRQSFVFSRLALFLPIAVLIILVLDYTVTGQLSAFNRRQAANFQASLTNSLTVAKESLKHGFLLGKGSESFPYLYSKYSNSNLDGVSGWDIRFSKSFSFVLDLLATGGIIVFAAYLFLLFSILVLVWRSYKAMSKEESLEQAIPGVTLLLIIVLIFEQFIYSYNIILLFLFFLALAVHKIYTDKYGITLYKNPQVLPIGKNVLQSKRPTVYLILGAVSMIFLISSISGTKIWLAQVFYQKALTIEDLNLKEKYLLSVISLDKKQATYRIALAKTYKDQALSELKKVSRERNLPLIESEVNNAVNSAKTAISLAPYSPAPYETLGLIYRDLADYSADSVTLSILAFKKASENEPGNPVILVELGKMYLKNNNPAEAEAVLNRAKNLKSDYFDANLFLSRSLANQGKYDEALSGLNELETTQGTVDVKIEIGRVYFNMNNYPAAAAKFEEAVAISPINANALYSLALTLEKEERITEAISYYRKVLNLNPNNNELRQKINAMEK